MPLPEPHPVRAEARIGRLRAPKRPKPPVWRSGGGDGMGSGRAESSPVYRSRQILATFAE